MLSEQRYEEILNVLDREGSVKATVLCGLLGTSRETIRRDLETMEAKGMLRRIHGGAMKMEISQEQHPSYTSFKKRKDEQSGSKEEIAAEAVEYIPEGQAIGFRYYGAASCKGGQGKVPRSYGGHQFTCRCQ